MRINDGFEFYANQRRWKFVISSSAVLSAIVVGKRRYDDMIWFAKGSKTIKESFLFERARKPVAWVSRWRAEDAIAPRPTTPLRKILPSPRASVRMFRIAHVFPYCDGVLAHAMHSFVRSFICSFVSFVLSITQKIARAYEVLTSADSRKEYDDLRYDQDGYFKKYGSEVVFTFAPQSDLVFVVVLILLVINGFVYFAQYNRWAKVCDRLAKAAMEDWSPSQGGSPDSKAIREDALKILAEESKALGLSSSAPSSGTSKKGANGKRGSKMTAKERKEKESEALRPIVLKLAYEITDFGAGFHKPTWKDLAILKMAIWPYHLIVGAAWQTKYWIRRIQKLELNEEEKRVLTERSVGQVIWEFSSEDEKAAMVGRELWNLSNLKEWNEEREFAKLSKSEQKQYKLMKKHEKMN